MNAILWELTKHKYLIMLSRIEFAMSEMVCKYICIKECKIKLNVSLKALSFHCYQQSGDGCLILLWTWHLI